MDFSSSSVVTSDPTTAVPGMQLSSSSSYSTSTSSSSPSSEETASSTAEEMAMEFQQTGIETKPGEYQQFLEQVQYYNDHHHQQQQQPNNVLQLATLPSEIDPNYHLQLVIPDGFIKDSH
ncbi:hypothetical protein Rs2_40802 [Raphanus sativus]|nr:hypothetical protein Rs2_40802 [Raphanus sativus]